MLKIYFNIVLYYILMAGPTMSFGNLPGNTSARSIRNNQTNTPILGSNSTTGMSFSLTRTPFGQSMFINANGIKKGGGCGCGKTKM